MTNEFLGTYAKSEPCLKCGANDFYVASGNCKPCGLEYQRKYRETHGRTPKARKVRVKPKQTDPIGNLLARKW